MKLIAIKPFSYATRRLLAGDEFEAPRRIAKALIGAKRARDANRGNLEAPTAAIAKQIMAAVFTSPMMEKPVVEEPESTLLSVPEEETFTFVEEEENVSTVEQLRAEARSLGIEVDGRWGIHRLRAEIENLC